MKTEGARGQRQGQICRQADRSYSTSARGRSFQPQSKVLRFLLDPAALCTLTDRASWGTAAPTRRRIARRASGLGSIGATSPRNRYQENPIIPYPPARGKGFLLSRGLRAQFPTKRALEPRPRNPIH